jgi:hypothetical protein
MYCGYLSFQNSGADFTKIVAIHVLLTTCLRILADFTTDTTPHNGQRGNGVSEEYTFHCTEGIRNNHVSGLCRLFAESTNGFPKGYYTMKAMIVRSHYYYYHLKLIHLK